MLDGLSCPLFSTVFVRRKQWIPQTVSVLNPSDLVALGGATRNTAPFESNQSLNAKRNPEAHDKADEGFPKIIPDDPAKISAFTIGEHIRKLLFFDP